VRSAGDWKGVLWIIGCGLVVTMIAAFHLVATSRANLTNASPPQESSAPSPTLTSNAAQSDPYRSECSDLEQERDSINARMRAGDASAEGGWFRKRLRIIAGRSHDLRCTHFH